MLGRRDRRSTPGGVGSERRSIGVPKAGAKAQRVRIASHERAPQARRAKAGHAPLHAQAGSGSALTQSKNVSLKSCAGDASGRSTIASADREGDDEEPPVRFAARRQRLRRRRSDAARGVTQAAAAPPRARGSRSRAVIAANSCAAAGASGHPIALKLGTAAAAKRSTRRRISPCRRPRGGPRARAPSPRGREADVEIGLGARERSARRRAERRRSRRRPRPARARGSARAARRRTRRGPRSGRRRCPSRRPPAPTTRLTLSPARPCSSATADARVEQRVARAMRRSVTAAALTLRDHT